MSNDLDFVKNYMTNQTSPVEINDNTREKLIVTNDPSSYEKYEDMPDDVKSYLTEEKLKRTFPTNPLIRHVLGENHPVVFSWYLLIQIVDFGETFFDNEGNPMTLKKDSYERERSDIQYNLGRILMIGAECFSKSWYPNTKNFPVVGDFVHAVRYEGTPLVYGDKKCVIIKDTSIKSIGTEQDLNRYAGKHG